MLMIERSYYGQLTSEYTSSDYFGTLHDFASEILGTSVWTVTTN